MERLTVKSSNFQNRGTIILAQTGNLPGFPIPINHFSVLLSVMDEITQAILHAKPHVCPTQIYRLQSLIYDSPLRARKTGALTAIIKIGSLFCVEKNCSRYKKDTKGTK